MKKEAQLLCLLTLTFTVTTHAASVTWTGTGSTSNWSDSSNWDTGSPSSGDSLTFSGSSKLSNTNNLTSGTSFSGITFSSTAGAFSLSGNSIILSGPITSYNSTLQTISNSLSLTSDLVIEEYGNLNLNGIISGSKGLNFHGRNTTTLSNANTYTGSTTLTSITSGGTLKLDFSAVGAPTSNILYNGVTAGTLITRNGTLQVTGASNKSNSQTFGGLTAERGLTNISLTAGSSGSVVVNLGAISQGSTNSGMLNINLPTGSQTSTNGITTTNTTSNGILTIGSNRALITVNSSDWATKSGNNIVAYSGYTANGSTSFSSNQNINMTSNTSLASSTTINTLRITNPSTGILSLSQTGSNLLTVSSGSILRPSDGGVDTHQITGGRLTGSANGGLNILQLNSSGGLQIDSTIIDNGTASYVAIYGPGTVKLGGANTYTGPTWVNGSNLQVSTNSNLGSTSAGGDIYLDRGQLTVTGGNVTLNNSNQGGDRSIHIYNGGTITSSSSGGTLVITGAIDGDGFLSLNGLGNTELKGSATYSGTTTMTGGSVTFYSSTGSSLSGNTSSGSKTATVSNASSLAVGQSVSGLGIQSGTYITAINQSTNTITLSSAATSSGSSLLTFGSFTSLGTGDIKVHTALYGSGHLDGNLILNAGSLNPGNSITATDIAAPNFLWNGNGSLKFNLGAGSTSDSLTLSGGFLKGTQYGSTYNFDLTQLSGYTGTSAFALIFFDHTDFSATDFTYSGSITGSFSMDSNTLYFTPITAPEPSTYVLFGLGGGFLVFLGYQKSRRPSC